MITPELLLSHLDELRVSLDLSEDCKSLTLEAAPELLTDELTDLLREHKTELLQLIYERKERDAIEWEGERTVKIVLLEGDSRLIEENRRHPSVLALISVMEKYRGGTIEFSKVEAIAA